MRMIEKSPSFLAYKAEKKLAEKINKMTHSLLYVLQINRYDAGLVFLIGKESDRNNEDAVKTWVTKRLCCPSCMRLDNQRTLANELLKALVALSDDFLN